MKREMKNKMRREENKICLEGFRAHYDIRKT